MKKCLILSASKIDYDQIPALSNRDFFVICADGGCYHSAALNLTPDLIIGDFDSYKEPPQPGCEVIRLSAEKDVTDTFAAVNEAVSRGYKDITVLGGTGGRIDHTLANISLIYHFIKKKVKIKILDSRNEIFGLDSSDLEIEKREGYKLSLLAAFENCCGVSVRGVKYPLKNATLKIDFPLGISNEFEGKKALVSVKQGTLLIILSKD